MSRWLRWNLICFRGRRCTHLVIDTDWGDNLDEVELPPDGTVVGFDYTCGGCGTRYRSTALLGGAAPPIMAPRMRL